MNFWLKVQLKLLKSLLKALIQINLKKIIKFSIF